MDPTESVEYNCSGTSICSDDDGWTTVVSRRRKKRADGGSSGEIVPLKMVSAVAVEDEWNGAGAAKKTQKPIVAEAAASNKNPKAKKTQKPIVSLSEAAAKIDNRYLAASLVLSMKSAQPENQLLRFVDNLGRELSEVEFPWLKVFPFKGRWPKLIDVFDVPMSDIPEPIFQTSFDWLAQLPLTLLAGFVLFAFRSTLSHLAEQRERTTVYGKLRELLTSPIPLIGEQLPSSKPLLAIFVTLAMAVRTYPNALTSVLANLIDEPSFQREDALPLTVWMIAQAPEGGSVSVPLHAWAVYLLPVVGNESCSPRSRDLILQLVEKILSAPHARHKLMRRALDKDIRVIPPPSFEILLRLTFPPSSARVKKATERFEAIYPFLKEVALAGSPAMEEVIQQIFTISLKLAGDGNPALAKEATAIVVWCVTENVGCCKQWDSLYETNLEASVAVLKKLVDEWKDHSLKLSSSPKNTLTLSQVVKSFRLQNKKAIAESGAINFLHKEADKSCKVILVRLIRGRCKYHCLKATTTSAVVLAYAGAFVALSLVSFAVSTLLSNAIKAALQV